MKKIYISFALLAFVLTSWSQEYQRMIADGSYTVQEIQKEAKKYFDLVGTDRGKGYKPYKRWEYNALRLMDEDGRLKTAEYYYNELERYNNYVNQNFDLSRTTVGNWATLGPTDWNQTSGWNPGVGRITSLAIEPANTDHIIVGGHTGGVWKTTNGGTSWTVLTDNLSNLFVSALAMDPTTASTYFWGTSGGTILKSTDAGATWNILSSTGFGNVNKILIDPTNTTKMYCSIEGGGLYKSTNSGASWTIIDAAATNGYDFEFKPGDTNTIYATGNQFYISTDGGATFASPMTPDPLLPWTQEYVSGAYDWVQATVNASGLITPKTGSGMAYFQINSYAAPVTILTSPSLDISGAANPELKFSFTQPIWSGPGYDDQDELRVLYKTSLAGPWMELAAYNTSVTVWTDITLALPSGSADYYIGLEGSANYGYGITVDDVSVEDATLGVIFEDGFENIGTGFSTGPKMIGVSKGATPASADAAVVYVLEANNGIFGGFYKSTDSGVTFTKLDHGTNNYFGYSSTADDLNGQAPRDMDIAVHPTNVDEVHIAGILTWKSSNGGASFDITSQWVPQTAAFEDIGYCHADVDILEFVGDDLYAGTDGGIFMATNTGTINSTYYTDLTAGLGIRQFYKIGISQTDPVIVTGGSQDNGTSVMDGTGAWTDWLGADGMESFVDKTNNDIMYGTSQFGSLYKTFNGGTTYGGITQPDGKGGQNFYNWIVPFEQDPITMDVIYCAFDEVYKSVNGGTSWTSISQNFAANIDELKVVPTNSSILYASINGALYKTIDGGATAWTTITGFTGNINSIALHPTDPMKIAIATTSADKVYVSADGGATWTSYLNNLPGFSAQTVTWQNNVANGLYVGMNYGIYYIDDSFAVWQPFSNGLPNVDIRELEINTANNKIYAGSYGRGLWASDIYDPALSISELDLQSILVYPNPASNEINLLWNKNDEIGIKIYNSLGKLMYSEKNQSIINTFKIDVSNYSSGLYFVSMNNSFGILTKKVIIE